MNALLVTDNDQDEAILGHALRLAGLIVGIERTVKQVLAKWNDHPADIIVVALRHPDPLALARDVRRAATAPLILVLDSLSEDLHLDLLETGVDWVIQRPYNIRLLIGYTKVLLRRAGSITRQVLPALQYAEITLDPISRMLKVTGRKPQRLSQLEFRLLHTLMIHQGQVLTTEVLVEHVWGYTGEGDRGLVRGLINRLRLKVEANPHTPRYIRTVSGIGYMFGEDENDS